MKRGSLRCGKGSSLPRASLFGTTSTRRRQPGAIQLPNHVTIFSRKRCKFWRCVNLYAASAFPACLPSYASLFLRPPLSTRVSPERCRCACDDRKRQEQSRLCFFKICQTAGCNGSRGQRVLYIFKMSLLVNACGKPHIEAHCSEILWSNWEAYLLLTSWRCKGHRQRSTSAFTLPSQHALPLGLSPICWLANCSLVKCPKPR